jgi:hypothetical protein
MARTRELFDRRGSGGISRTAPPLSLHGELSGPQVLHRTNRRTEPRTAAASLPARNGAAPDKSVSVVFSAVIRKISLYNIGHS